MACTVKPSSSGARLAYVKMTDCETVPPTPALQEIGFVSETLSRNTSNTESEEIYADRNVRDDIQTGVDVSGAVNCEWRINALKDWLVSGLQSNGAVTIDAQEAISINATSQDDVILSIDGASGAFAGLVVGGVLALGGYVENGNNGIVLVNTVTDANTLLVKTVEGNTLVTEAGGAGNTAYAEAHVNGQTRDFYLVEETFTDMTTPAYFRYLAQEVSAFNFAFGAQAVLTGDVSFIGRTDEQSETLITGATYLSTSTDPILDTVSSVGDIYEGGDKANSDVMSMTLALDNGSRGQTAIGTEGYVGVAHDNCKVAGDVEVYFEELASYEKFKAQTRQSLMYILKDSEGNALAVTMPNTKFKDMLVNAEGLGTDIMAKGGFVANFDEAINGTIKLTWLGKVA